jgi:hypothetical protein
MNNFYNNIPRAQLVDSANSSRAGLSNFYGSELPMNAGALDAMKGFFESKGFSSESADGIAYIMFYQADIDGYNPFDVLDNLKGLNGVELTLLVTEILNFNRFKTSFLGLTATYSTQPEVEREILP